jgi:DNA polymerase III epsilon subunit-like protein
MGLFVNKYDKADKFTPLAYNGQFDMDMLRIFFLKNQDNYFGSWFDGCLLDPLPVVRMLDRAGLIAPMENHRLATVAKMLDVQEGVAHDALSDVRMLYSIYKELIADYLTSPQRRRDICGQCMGLGDESQYKGE